MPLTNFPNGATSFGIPLVGSGNVSIPAYNGKVFFVNASGPSGDGTDPGSPLTTIADAITKCTSGAGDTIYVFPGTYEETLTVSKDYVAIIGAVQAGYARPDVTGTGIKLTVTGQGFMAAHIRFTSDDSDVVVQNGNGFAYYDCVFDGSAGMAATEACLRLVGLAADDSYTASEGIVQDCLFRGATSGIGLAIQHAALPSGVGCSDNRIVGNRFYGNGVDLQSLTNVDGGGAGIFLNTTIAGNAFMTGGAAYVYADMNQGAAGDLAANSALIYNNWFADDALIAAQFAIDGQPNVFFSGNFDAAGVVNGSTFNN